MIAVLGRLEVRSCCDGSGCARGSSRSWYARGNRAALTADGSIVSSQTHMPDIERWRTTWRGLGVVALDDELYGVLIGRYSEPNRNYHTVQHLDECFARLDEARSLAERIHEVELALWFHDAVYEVRSQDNEEQSASWAQGTAERAGLPNAVVERLHRLILATKHNAEPASRDEALLVDVDLAILGAAPERFDEYERQVRVEYSMGSRFPVPTQATGDPRRVLGAAACVQHRSFSGVL